MNKYMKCKNVFFFFGALTSKPYAFQARPWELRSADSVDIFDSSCANIIFYTKNNMIFKVLPKLNDLSNENWITDRARFSFDGFTLQRLLNPFYLYKKNVFIVLPWMLIFKLLNIELQFLQIMRKFFFLFSKIFGIAGATSSVENLFTFKHFINSLGSSMLLYNPKALATNIDLRSSYIFELKTEDIGSSLKNCLLINTNLRVENPILNLKLRKLSLHGLSIFNIGSNIQNIQEIVNLGTSSVNLIEFLEGRHKFCTATVASQTLCVLGSSILLREDSAVLLSFLNNLRYYLNSFSKVFINFLNRFSSCVGSLDLGFQSYKYDNLWTYRNYLSNNLIFCLNFFSLKSLNCRSFYDFFTFNPLVYIGSVAHKHIKLFRYLIPCSSVLEEDNYFINLDGSFSKLNRVLTKDNNSSNTITEFFNSFMPYLLHSGTVKSFDYSFFNWNCLVPASTSISFRPLTFSSNLRGTVYKSIFSYYTSNPYFSDVISSNSKVMHLSFYHFIQRRNVNVVQ